jgi:PAS domain S-box-containing protein
MHGQVATPDRTNRYKNLRSWEMTDFSNKKELLKSFIRRLHNGEDPNQIKREFQAAFKDAGPAEIAQAEEELIKEGMPQEEVHRLCDVHIAAFQDALEKEHTLAPAGHPIHTLMEEHKILLGYAGELKKVAGKLQGTGSYEAAEEDIEQIVDIEQCLKDSENHYLREENVLFPHLEKHGVTQPPAIMWMEHDKIRAMKKSLYEVIDNRKNIAFHDFVKRLNEGATALAEMLTSHFYKENNILFPTAIKMFSESEWQEVTTQFEEVGYCCFTPESGKVIMSEKAVEVVASRIEGMVPFETGPLSVDVVEAIFNNLPVDITFVDKDDTVQYFSQSKDRIFVRTKAVIGRKVQQCHPEKSIHVVNQIVSDFKNKKRQVAEFWLPIDERLIYIRYFPVWDKAGEYLGVIEVTQDITDIKKIEGEKRLL